MNIFRLIHVKKGLFLYKALSISWFSTLCFMVIQMITIQNSNPLKALCQGRRRHMGTDVTLHTPTACGSNQNIRRANSCVPRWPCCVLIDLPLRERDHCSSNTHLKGVTDRSTAVSWMKSWCAKCKPPRAVCRQHKLLTSHNTVYTSTRGSTANKFSPSSVVL